MASKSPKFAEAPVIQFAFFPDTAAVINGDTYLLQRA